MCYNCGCEMLNDPMGKGRVAKGGGSLTEDDFKHMAAKWEMDLEETKRNVYDSLKKHFEEGQKPAR